MFSLFVLIPFLCLILLNLPLRIVRKTAFGVVTLLSLAQVAFVLSAPVAVVNAPIGIFARFFDFHLLIDNLTVVMLAAIGLVVFVASCVARVSMQEDIKRRTFMNLLLIAFIGMNATVMLQDLFSMYVFIEVIAIASFILIAINKDAPALEGAFKYLLLSAFATVLMLASTGVLLLCSSSLTLSGLQQAVVASPDAFLIKLSLGLFLCGLFIKSGLFPFHWWLPDAYSAAPSAVSVLLAGIVTKVAGVYVLMRLVVSLAGVNFYTQQVLMALGALSIITGALLAMRQKDFKRMLAYSSISQVGYIILAIGCATPLAFAAAAFHMFNHAAFKSLLFVNAASVEKQVGTTDMEEMGGLAARMPVTGITSLVGFLSTAGVPPFSGFWSKLLIVLALWGAGEHGYAGFALLASVLTLGYMLVMQRNVFFGKLKQGLEDVKEAGAGYIIPQVVLAAIIIAAGLAFPVVLSKFILPVQSILLK